MLCAGAAVGIESSIADLRLEDGEEDAFSLPGELDEQSTVINENEDPMSVPLVFGIGGFRFMICHLELELGWDLTLRVQVRRANTVNSIWLRDEGERGDLRKTIDNKGIMDGLELSSMECELEDDPIINEEDIDDCHGACRPEEMKIYYWNVRRLGSPQAVRRLQHMLKFHHPQIFFFMETKLNANRIEGVKRRYGFFNDVDVPAEGSRGGLSIGWNGGQLVTLKSSSKNHIDVEIQEDEESPRWHFMSFYRARDVRYKAESCNLLRRLGRNNSLPWIVGGDFNDILFAHEKQGDLPREEVRMEAFRRTLDDCQLVDIGFSSPWFTWERGLITDQNIKKRIDRRVATDGWL
ncbi:hypothetical protein PVK06_042462 [Gossypium arboreum]|uniref:Endonuclease/exonuclease/phosphatase domain-containing protein n=1 Tax=Gossypium arboreum TaxID=29729 RepID=A0ABR0MKS4_GOSAR|nr:hypothetical protein PVK06_042462 [Gossypium arboreum]